MKKMFKKVNFYNLFTALVAVLSVISGVSGVAMAEAAIAALPDGGSTVNDAASITSISQANPDFFLTDVDRRITRIRPMDTPIDQISRYGKSSTSVAMEFEYGSVGTRPVMTTLSTDVTAQASGVSLSIAVADPQMFDIDDTIRVVGVKGYDEKGTTQTAQDLVLSVCGRDSSTNNPTVYAVNGKTNGKQNIYLPAIPKGTKLVRMGKACSELDAKTGLFTNVPEMKEQYCQKFMAQITESTYKKIVEERKTGQKVDWNFSDLEEDAIWDMRIGQESSFLFGVKNKVVHTSKGNSQQWFTEGIWWQAGQDIEVGSRKDGEAVITDDNLVDLAKALFCGTGVGNKRKVVFCGSEFQAALAKIKSEKYILREKDSVEVWNLKFKSVDTDFGELLTIHHELFDLNGMSDCALAIDPAFLAKKVFESFTRVNRDDMENGTSDSMTVMLKESCALYLRYPKAHARLKLAAA